jgi:hypothetical protein
MSDLMITNTKYLTFKKMKSHCKKTYDVAIENKQGYYLGTISWHGPFRKYTFRPDSDTVWDKSCLNEITKYLDQLMKEWSSQS